MFAVVILTVQFMYMYACLKSHEFNLFKYVAYARDAISEQKLISSHHVKFVCVFLIYCDDMNDEMMTMTEMFYVCLMEIDFDKRKSRKCKF